MIESAVNIDVNVNGTQTVQQASQAFEDLGDAVAKTQRQAEELALQFGINDERTQEAIRTAGKYKQQLELLDQAVDAHRGGQETLFRAVQGVGAGFELATGAMALFGSESEELNKVLMKVQGAMVFSQGLKDLKEFAPAIKNVGGMVTGALSNAFKSFGAVARTAIASTGIGVLVVAVGTLVAYWDEIIAKLNGVNKAQADLLDKQTESTKLAKEQLDDISAQENILRLQGKTEKEILNLKIQATKALITGLEAQLLTQKEIKKQQVETAKQNKELLQGLIMFAYAPINLILKGIDLALNALGKESNLLEGFTGGLASLVFDPEKVAKQADESIATTEKELSTLKNNLAGYQISVNKINEDAFKKRQEDSKKEADEQKRLRDEREQAEKAHREHLLKIEQDYQNATKQELDDSLKRLQEYYDAKNLGLLKQLNEGQITQKEYDAQSAELQKQHLNDTLTVQNDYGVSTVATETAIEQGKLDAFKNATAEKIKLDEARKQSEEQLYKASQDLANAVIGLVGEQTKVGKGIALAQIGADTARALSGALANSNSPTPDNVATGGLAGIAKYIALASTILVNAKRARDIIRSGNPATAIGGGGSIPQVSTSTLRQLSSSSLPQSSEFITADRRVYVLEGDIKRVTNRVNNTQAVSVVE